MAKERDRSTLKNSCALAQSPNSLTVDLRTTQGLRDTKKMLGSIAILTVRGISSRFIAFKKFIFFPPFFSPSSLVVAHFSDECTHGEVRLVNGSSEYNGRLEVCNDGVWGTVTSDAWSHYESRVVCRQLGYSGLCQYTLLIHEFFLVCVCVCIECCGISFLLLLPLSLFLLLSLSVLLYFLYFSLSRRTSLRFFYLWLQL